MPPFRPDDLSVALEVRDDDVNLSSPNFHDYKKDTTKLYIQDSCSPEQMYNIARAWAEAGYLAHAFTKWDPLSSPPAYVDEVSMYLGRSSSWNGGGDSEGWVKTISGINKNNYNLHSGGQPYWMSSLFYCNEDNVPEDKRLCEKANAYTSTQNGWFSTWHHTVLCPRWFDTLKYLADAIQPLRDNVAFRGDFSKWQASWLDNKAKTLLHESYHWYPTTCPTNKRIFDYVPTDPKTKYYQPSKVAQLALEQNTKSSYYISQAWSYAIQNIFGVRTFRLDHAPAPPPVDVNSQDIPDDFFVDQLPPGTPVPPFDINDPNSTQKLNAYSKADFHTQTTTGFAWITAADVSDIDTSKYDPVPEVKSAPAPPPPPSDVCGTWYKVVDDHFEIYGKNFDLDGAALQKQIKGCGDLSGWAFTKLNNDPRGYQWKATGNLPIGTKACVGRAVVSAGGNSPDGCTGAG